MTTPESAARDDDARDMEYAAEDAVADFVAAVLAIMAGVLALSDAPDKAAAFARARLAGVGVNLVPALRSVVADATERGAQHAAEVVDVTPAHLADPVLTAQVAATEARAEERLSHAAKVAASVRTPDDAAALASTIGGVANGAKADARWLAARAMALGVDQMCYAADLPRIWIPERKACLSCLAYAGRTAKVGKDFPVGLTFGDKPVNTKPTPRPPLHPNCRCRIEPYKGTDIDYDFQDGSYATALRREAERAVVRGLSDYESTPAALRAAKRLLTDGTSLPRTVIARAARDVKRGTFTDRPRGL